MRFSPTKLKIPLAIILFVAGLVHLFKPEVFLLTMPPYIPWHRELILFTGWAELLAVIGLFTTKLRRFTAWSLVLYFIAVLPAHFHVALNEIPMFGISHPVFLWGRIVFQAVFIGWAYWLTR